MVNFCFSFQIHSQSVHPLHEKCTVKYCSCHFCLSERESDEPSLCLTICCCVSDCCNLLLKTLNSVVSCDTLNRGQSDTQVTTIKTIFCHCTYKGTHTQNCTINNNGKTTFGFNGL